MLIQKVGLCQVVSLLRLSDQSSRKAPLPGLRSSDVIRLLGSIKLHTTCINMMKINQIAFNYKVKTTKLSLIKQC